jgi:hypothetical protein
MTTVDLAFSLIGTKPIPADHRYHLYAALSRVLPALHQGNGIGVHPIRGRQIGHRELTLDEPMASVEARKMSRLCSLVPATFNGFSRELDQPSGRRPTSLVAEAHP